MRRRRGRADLLSSTDEELARNLGRRSQTLKQTLIRVMRRGRPSGVVDDDSDVDLEITLLPEDIKGNEEPSAAVASIDGINSASLDR